MAEYIAQWNVAVFLSLYPHTLDIGRTCSPGTLSHNRPRTVIMQELLLLQKYAQEVAQTLERCAPHYTRKRQTQEVHRNTERCTLPAVVLIVCVFEWKPWPMLLVNKKSATMAYAKLQATSLCAHDDHDGKRTSEWTLSGG